MLSGFAYGREPRRRLLVEVEAALRVRGEVALGAPGLAALVRGAGADRDPVACAEPADAYVHVLVGEGHGPVDLDRHLAAARLVRAAAGLVCVVRAASAVRAGRGHGQHEECGGCRSCFP